MGGLCLDLKVGLSFIPCTNRRVSRGHPKNLGPQGTPLSILFYSLAEVVANLLKL